MKASIEVRFRVSVRVWLRHCVHRCVVANRFQDNIIDVDTNIQQTRDTIALIAGDMIKVRGHNWAMGKENFDFRTVRFLSEQ